MKKLYAFEDWLENQSWYSNTALSSIIPAFLGALIGCLFASGMILLIEGVL